MNSTAMTRMSEYNKTWCHSLIDTDFRIPETCDSCPQSVHTINKLTIATSVVGALSIPCCLTVVAAILANGLDRTAFRNRVILAMMLANAVYVTCLDFVSVVLVNRDVGNFVLGRLLLALFLFFVC